MYYGHTSNLCFSSCSLEFREFAAYQRENGRTGARSTASARGIRGMNAGSGSYSWYLAFGPEGAGRIAVLLVFKYVVLARVTYNLPI